MSTIDPAVREFLLAFADDEHLMGQRHTEWIGVAPFLEEDMAFASIGQDELGHAALLYEVLSDDIDALALHRLPQDYRSCWLVEEPCTDWADALIRHWLYDTAEELRWESLLSSSLSGLGDIARRALREEAFHIRHANALLDALLGSSEAQARLLTSLDRLLPLAVGLFEAPAGESAALEGGVSASPMQSLLSPWRQAVDDRFGTRAWTKVDPPDQQQRRMRSEHFEPMYASMREVILLDPTAVW